MVNLAKKAKCTYSRYADDLTFSTNKKVFPQSIAVINDENNWTVAQPLREEVEKAGFKINEAKISMQYRTSRQMTTGLIVNEKVNIRKEYYRKARSMCHELFQTGHFYIDEAVPEIVQANSEEKDNQYGTLDQLEGILSFIYQVKRPHYLDADKVKVSKPTAITKLYREFLCYRHFFSIEKPLIVCEGTTDPIYLKCALKKLRDEYKEFIQRNDEGEIDLKVGFLNMSKNLKEVFDISTGTSGLVRLITHIYGKNMKGFKGEGKKHPVVVLVDNDDGANVVKGLIKNSLKINDVMPNQHYKINDNLYVIFTPEDKNGTIEDLFDETTLNIKLNGKNFNRANSINIETDYGKIVFAEQIVKARQEEIDFSGFRSIFDRLRLIIKEYSEINL